MPLAFMDGFDSYHTVNNTNITSLLQYHYQSASSNGPGPRVADGRYNGKSITLESAKGNNWSLRLPINEFITVNTTKIIIGFNFRITSGSGANHGGISLCGGSTTNNYSGIGFSYNNIYLNNGISTFLNSGNLGIYSISPNTWYHLSIVMTGTHAASTFTCQVYLDDDYILAGTVTKGAERSYRIWSQADGSWQLDDLYVLHNDGSDVSRLDPTTRIETILPTAAKNNTETWQYTGVSAFESCNNIPFVSNEYISIDQLNTSQEFEFSNLTNIVGSSYGQLRSLSKGINGTSLKHIVNGNTIRTHTVTDSLDSYTSELPTNVLTQSGTNNIQAGVSS